MKANAVAILSRPGWFKVIVSHDSGDFRWRWELGPESPYEEDAVTRANRFNEALLHHDADSLKIWRPVQSLSDDIYGTKTQPSTPVQHE